MIFYKWDESRAVIKDVYEYISTYIYERRGQEMEIWVGCDSERRKNMAEYAIVICLYLKGHGAHVIYRKEKVKVKNTLERLWNEVLFSLEVAEFLKRKGLFRMKTENGKPVVSTIGVEYDSRLMGKKTTKNTKVDEYEKEFVFEKNSKGFYIPNAKEIKDFVIHIDFNSKKVHESAKLYDAAINTIESSGYKAIAKPEAFSASYAADKLL